MIRVKVKTISPIFIGNGEFYYSYLLVKNKKINESRFLSRFFDYLKSKSQNPSSINIEGLSNDFEKFKEEFQKQEISIDDVEYEIQISEGLLNELKISNRQIFEFIKYLDIQKKKQIPFIPGSTIKGIFTTALVYNYFKEKREGLQKIREKSSHMLKLYSNLVGVLEDIVNIYVSDVIPEKYTLRLGKLYYGRIPDKSTFLELLVDFEGTFTLKSEIENIDEKKLIDYVDSFSRDYLEKLKKLSLVRVKNATPNIENEIKNNRIESLIKNKNEKLMIVGRYANLFSKSLCLLENVCNVREKPKYIRLATFDDKQYDIIGVCSLSII